jgi:hypothetical protein
MFAAACAVFRRVQASHSKRPTCCFKLAHVSCFDLPIYPVPLQALTAALYAVSGVRGVEIGSSCFGHVDEETGEFIPARLELLRLALPRRCAGRACCGLRCMILRQSAEKGCANVTRLAQAHCSV